MSNSLIERRSASQSLSALAVLLLAVATVPAFAAGGYDQLNLVTDDQTNLVNSGFAPALHVDPSLVNPWGLAAGPATPMWVANNGTGTATLYDGADAGAAPDAARVVAQRDPARVPPGRAGAPSRGHIAHDQCPARAEVITTATAATRATTARCA